MTRLTWDDLASRLYSRGVDRGVYFKPDAPGVAWNGLISVVESVDSDDPYELYLDGVKVVNRRRFGDFKASVEALANPDRFYEIFGETFGFSYRIMIADHYQIHLVYNVVSYDGGRARTSMSDSPDLSLLTAELTTKRQLVDGKHMASHLIIDSRYCNPDALERIEDIIYGNADEDSTLPSPEDLYEIFEDYAVLVVTDHGDGSATISGPDVAVFPNGIGGYTISWPSVIQKDAVSYQISSL
jgi:hypothetical protein